MTQQTRTLFAIFSSMAMFFNQPLCLSTPIKLPTAKPATPRPLPLDELQADATKQQRAVWAAITGISHFCTSTVKSSLIECISPNKNEDKLGALQLAPLSKAMAANALGAFVCTGLNESVNATAIQCNLEDHLGAVVSKNYDDSGNDFSKLTTSCCETLGTYCGKLYMRGRDGSQNLSLELGKLITGSGLFFCLSTLRRQNAFMEFLKKHNGEKAFDTLCLVSKNEASISKCATAVATDTLYGASLSTFKKKQNMWAGAVAEAGHSSFKKVLSDSWELAEGKIKKQLDWNPCPPSLEQIAKNAQAAATKATKAAAAAATAAAA